MVSKIGGQLVQPGTFLPASRDTSAPSIFRLYAFNDQCGDSSAKKVRAGSEFLIRGDHGLRL